MNAIINYWIVSFCVFLFVKGVNSLKKKEAEKPAEPATVPRSEFLLEEIRDALVKK
ncbi:MAG: MscL family protein [Micavibrio sp.]|nr:MscL family protein [Micavibrio sp.]